MKKIPKLFKEQKPSEVFTNFIKNNMKSINGLDENYVSIAQEPGYMDQPSVSCGNTSATNVLKALELFLEANVSHIRYRFGFNNRIDVEAVGNIFDRSKIKIAERFPVAPRDPNDFAAMKKYDSEITIMTFFGIDAICLLEALENFKTTSISAAIYSVDNNLNVYVRGSAQETNYLITPKNHINMSNETETPQLTFGQNAVGLNFNPAKDDAVTKCKQGFADLIDQMHEFRKREGVSADQARHASVAITEMESAQMRAVKALTSK